MKIGLFLNNLCKRQSEYENTRYKSKHRSCEAFRVKVKNGFKRCRTSIKDAPRSGAPKSAMTPENIDKANDIISAER